MHLLKSSFFSLSLLLLNSCGDKPQDKPTVDTEGKPAANTEQGVKPAVGETQVDTEESTPMPTMSIKDCLEEDNAYQLSLHFAHYPKAVQKNRFSIINKAVYYGALDCLQLAAENSQNFYTSLQNTQREYYGGGVTRPSNAKKSGLYILFDIYKVDKSTRDSSYLLNKLVRTLRYSRVYTDDDILELKYLMSQGIGINFHGSISQKHVSLARKKGIGYALRDYQFCTALDVAMLFEQGGTRMQDFLREYGCQTAKELCTPERAKDLKAAPYDKSGKLALVEMIKPKKETVAKYAVEVQAFVDYYKKGAYQADFKKRFAAAKKKFAADRAAGIKPKKEILPGQWR